jgi:hypothetical protein
MLLAPASGYSTTAEAFSATRGEAFALNAFVINIGHFVRIKRHIRGSLSPGQELFLLWLIKIYLSIHFLRTIFSRVLCSLLYTLPGTR